VLKRSIRAVTGNGTEPSSSMASWNAHVELKLLVSQLARSFTLISGTALVLAPVT